MADMWVYGTGLLSLSLPEADEHFTGLETPDFGLCYQRSHLTTVRGAVAIRIAKTLYNGDLRGSAPTVGTSASHAGLKPSLDKHRCSLGNSGSSSLVTDPSLLFIYLFSANIS